MQLTQCAKLDEVILRLVNFGGEGWGRSSVSRMPGYPVSIRVGQPKLADLTLAKYTTYVQNRELGL